jgi:hypothetical protein
MAKGARVDYELLSMALVGYVSQKAKIEAAIAEIRVEFGNHGTEPSSAAAFDSLTIGKQTENERRRASADRSSSKKAVGSIPSGARPNCETKAQNERRRQEGNRRCCSPTLGRVTKGEVRIGDKPLIHLPSPRIGSFIDRGTCLAPYHDRTRCGSIPIQSRPAAMHSGNAPTSHPSRPPLGEFPF